MTRRTLIASATIVLTALLGWPLPSAAASSTASETHTFTPVADASVSAATPRRNYGKSKRLYADADPITRNFMRFKVQNLNGPIVSASLWVYVVRGSGTRYRIRRVANNHWGERTVTFANQPRSEGPTRLSPRHQSGSWTAIDVSSFVTDDSPVSFRLATRSSSTVTIRSREARRKKPRLIVKTATDVQAPTAPTNLVVSRQTATSVSVSWTESTDDVGIVGYRIYVDAVEVGTATAPGYTVSSLKCGTAYTLGVEAYDLGNNVSEMATFNASTDECPSEPSPASCTYYVNAGAGDDSNAGTSEAAAWRSLAKVTNTALAPGHTVCFARDSVWTGQHLSINESGTSDAKITLGVYGAGTNPPIFDGTGAPSGYGTFLHGAHIVWDGITARDHAQMAIEVTGDSVLVRNSRFTLNGRALTTREGADNFRFTGNTCADNNLMIVNTVGGDDDYGAECVALVGSNAEIDQNVCYGSDASSYDYGRDGSCINLYGASNARVHDNIAYGNDNFAELGKHVTDASCTDNRFWNNVIRGSSTSSRSIQFVVHIGGTFGPCTFTVFDHNSLALSNASRGIGLYHGVASGATALTIRNNAVRSFSGSTIAVLGSGGSVADSYNHFFGGPVAWPFGTGSGLTDPLFISATDLHLQGGSPSIDSGTNLAYTADVEGNPLPSDGNCSGTLEADRGAYEYQNGSC